MLCQQGLARIAMSCLGHWDRVGPHTGAEVWECICGNLQSQIETCELSDPTNSSSGDIGMGGTHSPPLWSLLLKGNMEFPEIHTLPTKTELRKQG